MTWNKYERLLVIVILAAIAFGVNFMGWEQLRANSGFFVALPEIPSPQPTPHTKSF